MTLAPDLPTWAAIIVAIAALLGAAITLIGAIGLLRLPSFYQRVHPPTLGMTFGAFFILCASMLCFSILQSRLVLHEILIGMFLLLTTPVTLIILTESALREEHGAQTAAFVRGEPVDEPEQ